MKRSYLAVFMFVAALFCPAASTAGNPFLPMFIGLWEAVDPSDGSLTQRSISCDDNGQCTILGSDSFWVVAAVHGDYCAASECRSLSSKMRTALSLGSGGVPGN